MGDDGEQKKKAHKAEISIHVPRVGDDKAVPTVQKPNHLFQSTSPVWGTTIRSARKGISLRFQSTSPVWGTTNPIVQQLFVYKFQSTSPVWGTTTDIGYNSRREIISIHVPRVGDDK